MGYVYGLVTFGYAEDYNFSLVRANALDKEKLIDYCKLSKSTNSFDEENLNILAIIDSFESTTDLFETMFLFDIHHHQKKVRESLEEIYRLEKTESCIFRNEKKEMMEKLVGFNFLEC